MVLSRRRCRRRRRPGGGDQKRDFLHERALQQANKNVRHAFFAQSFGARQIQAVKYLKLGLKIKFGKTALTTKLQKTQKQNRARVRGPGPALTPCLHPNDLELSQNNWIFLK